MLKMKIVTIGVAAVLTGLLPAVAVSGNTAVEVPLYAVHEVTFSGPDYAPGDKPAVEVDLATQWRHESGRPTYKIHGFWATDRYPHPKDKPFLCRKNQ
jgi:hypothetical protein